jgi:hypothetical protein
MSRNQETPNSAQTELQRQVNTPKAIDPPAAAPQVSDPAPAPVKISWSLVLPPGKWGFNIRFGDKLLTNSGSYSGAVRFPSVSTGEVKIQLTTPQTATEWRSATPSDQQTISWQTMKEVR